MTNRYLQDNFAPVDAELTAFDLPVTGTIPDHLDGRYLRNGPNPGEDPGDRHHWFLGQGMVHGVRLRDGGAEWYRNRFVRPQGDDSGPNTNVLEHAGHTLAIVEAGQAPYELTHELETVGPWDAEGTLAHDGVCGYTAHPHEDPGTGALHAVSYNWMRGNKVDYSVIEATGRVTRHVEVETTGAPMLHDCALTEHYVAIYDLPVTFDLDMVAGNLPRPAKALAGSPNVALGQNAVSDPYVAAAVRGDGPPARVLPYSWDDDYPARIGLLPRDGGSADVTWFDIDPCYVFHTLNAYEDAVTGEVVIDAVRHPRMFATDFTGPDEGPSSLVRFTLDLTAGKAREHRFDETYQEFPRYDERLTGRRHRYGYAVGFANATLGDRVLKHDVEAGTTQVRTLGHGLEAGELCFVPNPGSTVEDDGVLMGYVYDRARGLSDLRILDAQTLDDVASVHLPGRVPAGFHGNWSPTAR